MFCYILSFQLLHWVWGHKTSLSAINLLSFSERKIIFYAAGPVGVCLDWVQNKQYLLLAHVSSVTKKKSGVLKLFFKIYC